MRGTLMVCAVMLFAALPSSSLAATVQVDDTYLLYAAAAGELNDAHFSESGGIWTISDTGAVITAGPNCDQISDHEATCSGTIGGIVDIRLGDLGDTAAFEATSSGAGVRMSGQEGDDHLTLCSVCDGALDGGAGADTLEGGDMGDTLVGGDGLDTLIGGARRDFLYGDSGNDTVEAGGGNDEITPGDGDDSLDGGPGRDAVVFAYFEPGVVVDLRLGTATGQGAKTLVDVENAIATKHRDELYGDGARNRLDGRAGNDLLVGRGGDDSLCGCGGRGIDRDHLNGGRGDDHLSGRRGADRLVGGPGDDLFSPGPGEDRAWGGGGDDRFRARDGFRDLLFGGRGGDIARLDRGLDVTRSIEISR